MDAAFPAVMPGELEIAELADAALSCEPLARARRLAGWVGQGRTLTASGVLRPADAEKAYRDLGIGSPILGPRSALDVEDLTQDWETAIAAGFIEVDGRQAWAADLAVEGSQAYSDPGAILGSWVRAVTWLLDLGDEEPCPGCLVALHELRTTTGALTVEQLVIAVEAVFESVEPESEPCSECGQLHGESDQLDLFDLLGDEDWDGEDDGEDAAEHVADVVTDLVAFGAAEISGELVQLTPLGEFLAGEVFLELEVPPDADAATMVSVISEYPPALGPAMAQPWLSARSMAAAVSELLTFAESASGSQRMTALAFTGELGTDSLEALREWASRPGIGAYARQWLRSHGEPVRDEPADGAWLAADGLCLVVESLADTVPSAVLRDALAEQIGDELAESVELILGSGHPKAEYLAALLTGPPVLVEVSAPAPDTVVYRLKITLRGITKPPVWRRVLVPASITLRGLHGVIQQAMGWDDSHLHSFADGRQQYGAPDADLGLVNDSKVRLSQVLAGPGDRLRYTYDFGDDWEHDIVVEEALLAEPGETYPSCVAGKGACPPDDCGGAGGYTHLKEVLADPSRLEHLDTLDWLGLDAGEDFDPKEFSVAEVNALLAASKRTR